MSTAEFATEFSNTAMGDAAEKIMNFVETVVKLRDGHPDHLKLAADMAGVISPVYENHGLSATLIPPILLSAAMEIAEHLDETRIVPALVRVKPKSKLATKRTKSAHESQESKGNDTGLSREKSPQAYTSSQKGKGREVVPGENDDEAVEVKRGRATRVQKRKGSNTTSLPIAVGTTKQVADSTSKPTKKTSKHFKVASETVTLTENALKEDSKADQDGPEIIPPCDGYISFVVKDMAPQVPNFELSGDKGQKQTHSSRQLTAEEMVACAEIVVSDDDAGAIPAAALSPPATSVPPITTLSLQDDQPSSVGSPSFIEDPPIGSVSTAPLQQMDVHDSGKGLTKVLEGMTLEVILRVSIAQLHQENTAATEQLKTLQARITSQDATLLKLQGLRAEVAALQDQVKRMREESTARDEQLCRAQDQLGQQERATALLQDAYNTIRQRLTGQPQPLSSPFTNTMYLTNPMYGGGQSMVPVNMGQMQAMEGMYFNLPSSVGNISTGSMLGGPSAGPSAGPSVSTIADSSRTGGDTTSGVASSR
ncbi:hypothetical protein P692DRAFT_201860282 [Suillus brevipes Sb2]|nr:hypothetical protein P692DRAFT_201860282 [Suillus brevipes Sb2]